MAKKTTEEWRKQAEREQGKYKHYHLKVHINNKNVIDKLESVPSKNGYILELIRKDINK